MIAGEESCCRGSTLTFCYRLILNEENESYNIVYQYIMISH